MALSLARLCLPGRAAGHLQLALRDAGAIPATAAADPALGVPLQAGPGSRSSLKNARSWKELKPPHC